MQNIALVTGGSKGIGFAIAQKLLLNGFKVIIVSRTIGEFSGSEYLKKGDLIWYEADLAEKAQVKEVVNKVEQEFSKLDILVNNAGIFIPGEIHKEEDDVFELQMAVNLNASYYLSKGLLTLLQQGSGIPYVFNLCSTAGIKAYPNGGSYCISKHAMLGFSKVLRIELSKYNIAVSTVIPGATFTDSWKDTDLPESRFINRDGLAEIIWTAWESRIHMVTEEIIVRPMAGDI